MIGRLPVGQLTREELLAHHQEQVELLFGDSAQAIPGYVPGIIWIADGIAQSTTVELSGGMYRYAQLISGSYDNGVLLSAWLFANDLDCPDFLALRNAVAAMEVISFDS